MLYYPRTTATLNASLDNRMTDEINYKNNPLHGVSLKNLLVDLVDQYGFEILYAYLNINCFKTKPSIDSSIKFLKKTDWAREKVESFYLYQLKSLPRATDEQFELSPRDRIIPEGQIPGQPAELSLEDAERLQEKRAKKAKDRKQRAGDRHKSNKKAKPQSGGATKPPFKKPNEAGDSDPWAKWR